MSQPSDSSDDLSLDDLECLSTKPPPPEDVHYASTAVAELPSAFLDSLKKPSVKPNGSTAPAGARAARDSLPTLPNDAATTDDLDDLPLLAEQTSALEEWIETGIGVTPPTPSAPPGGFRAETPSSSEETLSFAQPPVAPPPGLTAPGGGIQPGFTPPVGFEPPGQAHPSIVPVVVVFVMALSLAATVLWTVIGLFY